MMNNRIYLIFAFAAMVFLSISCGKEKQQNVDWPTVDDKIIRDYLEEKNIDAIKHPSGIYYIITKEGNGRHPNPTSVVRVNYKGYLLNGEVFDQNNSIEFPLNGVIQGWTIGIPLIDKGGSGQLFIPSYYGYGRNSPPGSNIPPNSVLIFDVDLLDF